MAKKKAPEIRRSPTAGEVAKWQKDALRNRIVFICCVVVVIAVLGLMGYGYYDRVYQPDHAESNKLHKTVIVADQNKFNLQYVIDMTRFLNLQAQAANKNNQNASFTPSYTLNHAVQMIEYNQLLEQEATGLGIAVSDEEVNAKIKSMILPSNAPQDLSESQYQKYFKAYVKNTWHVTTGEFRDVVKGDMLRTKLQEYLKGQLPKTAEQVHIEGLLLNSGNLAEISDRLVFTGDSLTDVAKQVSLVSEASTNGADLGWMVRGIMGDDFDNAVFGLPQGVFSHPIKDTTGNYPGGAWQVSVLETNSDKELDDNQVSTLTNVNMGKWFEQKLKDGLDSKRIIDNMTDELKTWATQYMNEHPVETASS